MHYNVIVSKRRNITVKTREPSLFYKALTKNTHLYLLKGHTVMLSSSSIFAPYLLYLEVHYGFQKTYVRKL